ncbi:WD repeat-containing protein 79 [Arthroderma uncinatum]|uniref:WD repeat-containing protein 79 n=1 Tax=Arthroderma uncinatum TaxID=74035 RepID=UPI00144A5B29|nr:WD repeat-containing protein 79 [Arthroderma uncinatum]KAF3490869.1 WD repeat-containing protein 79 [Arthroderma uncinatum]
MHEPTTDTPRVKCVACTSVDDGLAFASDLTSASKLVDGPVSKKPVSNYFKSAQWSADGTTVITNSADNHIRSYILPPDLLDEKDAPHTLRPYHVIPSKEPIYSAAIYPFYDLQDPSTTCLLSGLRDHPISLVSPTTEAFITPHSLLYPSSLGGTHFLAGCDSLICLFDISRPGKDGPVSRLPTIPSKRKKIVGGGVGMKGIVSAMAVDSSGSGILAAGTFTRHIGLYGDTGSGDTIATFSIADTAAERAIGGNGVTQVLWSPCGRYLYIVERKSDGMLVYDIRVTGQLVGWLEGRKAMTNQRLDVDIVAVGETSEIWAGGTDGVIRMWKNPSHAEGGLRPIWEKHIHDGKRAPFSFAKCNPHVLTAVYRSDDEFRSSSDGKCIGDLLRAKTISIVFR